jgi:uncharacterized membrane protein
MKPLIVLLAVFVLSILLIKVFRGSYNYALSARIAMSAMLAFTSIAHFVFTKGMAMMLPDFIPYKIETVYITGLIELLASIGLFIPAFRITIAWLLIVFFLLVLPANIYASIKQVDYQKGTLEGNGLVYLWFRIPLQILFIIWIYLSSIKN